MGVGLWAPSSVRGGVGALIATCVRHVRPSVAAGRMVSGGGGPSVPHEGPPASTQQEAEHEERVRQPPTEPGPEDCCQTGCFNRGDCVWDQYFLEMALYQQELKEAAAKEDVGTEPPS